jgi:hypothetical protein
MPILDDIMDHDVIGPAIRQGIQEGRQQEGVAILRRLLGKRFGEIPSWAEERLNKLSVDDIEDLSVRLLDAAKLSDLFELKR